MDAAVYKQGVVGQLNIANWITGARALMFLPVIACSYFSLNYQAVGFIALAGFTDWLDGFLARRYNMSTPLGRVGDPIADKLFMAFVLLPAVFIHGDVWLFFAWVLSVGYDVDNTWRRRKEIARALLNLSNDTPDLPATMWSKAKTALLFIVAGYCYAPSEFSSPLLLTFFAQGAMIAVGVSWVHNRWATLRRFV